MFLNFGIDEQGPLSRPHRRREHVRHLQRALARACRARARSPRPSTRTPISRRSTARPTQFTAPLRDPASQVYRGGLRLEHVEERHLVCPYATAFAQHRDAERFAREYIPTLRSWSEPTFASGLSPRARSEERARILDEFYGRYERLVAKSPAGHGMDYIHIHIVCAKE